MKLHEVQQGTPAWHALRAGYFTASEASAMMGVSKYMTRQELLRKKATGFTADVSASTQNLFDRGHATEATARAIAERMIGEELYQATVTDDADYLLASLDGITMDGNVIFEHKLLNAGLVADLAKGIMPECHKWQVIQALVVTGAERCLFAVSDGTEENFHHIWVTLDFDDVTKLMAGWKQFGEDLKNYQHIDVAPQHEGRAPEALPALHIEVKGMVTASNVEAFRDHAIAVFQSINRDLQTDADFADAEKAVKWCKSVEDKLQAAKQHALSQTADIDALFRAIDAISDEAKAVRLDLDKLVKKRKEDVRHEIQQENMLALGSHIQTINARLDPIKLPQVFADFAGVMKGKKTVQSLRDACGDELARAKIEASQMGELIDANLKHFNVVAWDSKALFADLQTLVTKPADDFAAVVKMRIQEHAAAEQAKADALREQIRLEEEAKAKAEAEAKVRAEIAAIQEPPMESPFTEQERTEVPIRSVMPEPTELKRPSDKAIIFAVATAFNTDFHTAAQWIHEINASNMRGAA